MNPFKPQLDCRNCKYYERFALYCNMGYRLKDNKDATDCKSYRGNGSYGSGNK